MSIFLISVLVAMTVSFVCSLLEATLLSLTPSQVAAMGVRYPGVGSIWQRFKSNVDQPIAMILMLNTAAHTIGAAVAGSQFNELFGDDWIVAFSLAFTFLMLQYTEILPKALGVRYNREVAIVAARPMAALTWLFSPMVRVAHWINSPFEPRRKAGAPATLEELSALAGLARLSNLIGSHEERIIKGASRLSQMTVRQVMIPVEQVTFLSTSQRIADAVLTAHMDPHTRFPICEKDNKDRVLGYVNFKEMIYHMRMNPSDPSLAGITRPVHFVTPGDNAAALLRVFVDEHVHMAIVREAAGGGKTLGLVTLEDVVEELVGELEDEFDRLPKMVHSLTSGTLMVGGGTPIAEVAGRLGVSLPNAVGTASAWLIGRMGKVPAVNEVYREAGLEFMVRRTRRGMIFEVAVSRGPS